MKQQTLGIWLKIIIIGMGICGLIVYCGVLPVFGQDLADLYPEFSSWYYPWLIFLILTVIPCYGVLLFAWKIAGNIGEEKAFCYDNGKAFRGIYWMAFIDTVFFFLGNVVLLFMNKNHPGILLVSLILVFFGIAIAVAAKALAHLVDRAAELQEESDWTI